MTRLRNPLRFANVALTVLLSSGTAIAQPQSRACHAAVYAEALGGTIVFGGARECGVGVLPDDTLWLWNGSRWSKLAQGGPSPREDAQMVFDSRNNLLVLFGGRRDGRIFTDTWTWQRTSGWRNVDTPMSPGALEHASIAFDSLRGRAVLFGGATARTFQAGTWEWNGATWAKISATTGPPARIGHSMTWDSSTNAVVMFGGFSPERQFIDLWRWNGGRWTLVDSVGPTHTEGASIAIGKPGLIVAGPGLTNGKIMRVWNYKDNKWAASDAGAAQNAPAQLVGAATSFDARRGVLVVTGGGPISASKIRVAEFDGVSWRVIP